MNRSSEAKGDLMHRQKACFRGKAAYLTLLLKEQDDDAPFCPVAPVFIVSVDWKLEAYYCLET